MKSHVLVLSAGPSMKSMNNPPKEKQVRRSSWVTSLNYRTLTLNPKLRPLELTLLENHVAEDGTIAAPAG